MSRRIGDFGLIALVVALSVASAAAGLPSVVGRGSWPGGGAHPPLSHLEGTWAIPVVTDEVFAERGLSLLRFWPLHLVNVNSHQMADLRLYDAWGGLDEISAHVLDALLSD